MAQIHPTEASKPGDWWLQRGHQVYGPYDLATLRFILADGRALPEDLVRCGEEAEWRRLEEVLAGEASGPLRASEPPTAAPQRRVGDWVVGVIVFLILLVAIPYFVLRPLWNEARNANASSAAEENLRETGLALQMYAQENAGLLPPGGQWIQALGRYVPDLGIWRRVGPAYTFNESLAGQKLSSLKPPAHIPLAWDATPYLTGEKPKRKGYWVLYADGTVKHEPRLPTTP